MESHPVIQLASQSLEPGDLVQLYIIDLSPIGVNEQWPFCPTGNCTFRGISFVKADVEAEGFEWSGQGTAPQPRLRMTNATRLISAELTAHEDLIGARLTRFRTYKQFLDDGASPNPDAMFSPDHYVFEQLSGENKFQVEWVLSAAMDQQGRMIPGRVIVRDFCLWRYRIWNPTTGAFDDSKAQCPYKGTASFDAKGNPTTPDKDRPGRTLATCCKPRFGENAEYPFGGFPGVARVRL